MNKMRLAKIGLVGLALIIIICTMSNCTDNEEAKVTEVTIEVMTFTKEISHTEEISYKYYFDQQLKIKLSTHLRVNGEYVFGCMDCEIDESKVDSVKKHQIEIAEKAYKDWIRYKSKGDEEWLNNTTTKEEL